jgi:hypothetical protein
VAGGPTEPDVRTEPEAEEGTRYVLVPVPAELVHDVNSEIIRLQWTAQGVAQPWEVENIVEMLLSSDDTTVRMVRAAAHTILADRVLLDVELAEHLGVSTRELAGLIREVNDSAPPGVIDLIVLHRIERDGTVVREVRMVEEHARRIESAVLIARRRRRR